MTGRIKVRKGEAHQVNAWKIQIHWISETAQAAESVQAEGGAHIV